MIFQSGSDVYKQLIRREREKTYESGKEALFVLRGERNREELFGGVVGGGEDLPSLESYKIVDEADGSLALLANGQVLLGWANGYS